MSILLQWMNEDLSKAGSVQQDNCTFTAHQRHVNCVGSQHEHCGAAKFSMHLAHMSSITHIHYEVTDWDCFTQLWASPWSHNSTNCNIYSIWLMLKYLYATSLIPSPLLESQLVRLPACKMENVSITVLKMSITTHMSKKRLFCLADLSLRRSHRSLCDKPDILR